MPARLLRGLLPAAALLLAVLLGWYYVMGTPQYSLHRLAAALHRHDAAAAERFVDVDRIAQAASEVIADDFLGPEPRAAPVGPRGLGSARATAARVLRPLVAERVRREIARMAREGGADSGPLALPAGLLASFWLLDVAREPPDAWVSCDEGGRGRTRFRMSQQADRSWRITEFDRDWVRRQLRQPVPR